MPSCAAFDPTGPYVSSVLAYADCQALSLGEAGYRALGSGTPFGMALTGLLTIFVALIGYRLLLGGMLSVREAAITALKLGIVLALATQWQAFRTVIFEAATRAPEQAASGFLSPQGFGAQGSPGLAARIDGINAALAELLEQSAAARNTPQPGSAAQAGAAPPPAAPPQARVLPVTAEKSLDTAVAVQTVAALAGFVSVRVILALLLAMAPAFIACMLFDATRGLFAGWLRVLAGTALAALAVPVVVALQLSIAEPQVLALRAALDANRPLLAMPQQVLGTAAFFALVLLAACVAVTRVALGLRLPGAQPRDAARGPLPERQLALPPPEWFGSSAGPQAGPALSRAQGLANAAQTADWRGERMREASQLPQRMALPHGALPGNDGSGAFPAAVPLGQEGRRHSPRQSTVADRRDQVR